MRNALRIASTLLVAILGVAWAGNLNVTSPTDGAFLGKTNTVRFNVTGAVVEVTVKIKVTDPNGGTINLEQKFTPDNKGEFTGSIALNFNDASPEGQYTLLVTATEPNNTYNDVTRNVNVDVVDPEFVQFSPVNNSFVKGIIPIRVTVREPNLKEWRVQINNQDIPNNTGSTATFEVLWDSRGILNDGPQTITLKATDLAENDNTQTISVTIDRVAPQIDIQTPRNGTNVVPNSRISVVLSIQDAGVSDSINAASVLVGIYDMNGKFLGRPARALARFQNGSLQWIGRIRKDRTMPSQFKLIVDAVDKAGNRAVSQEVVVTIGSRKRR